MIITKEGCIVVAVGEVISYNGRVYGCMAAPDVFGPGGCGEECAFSKDSRICARMECRSNMRADGLCVLFKLFGEMEGGQDDNQ